MDHDGASGLITRIFLPERDIGAVGNAGLNRPLIAKFGGRENSGLGVIIESIDERVAGHEIIRGQLRFDVGLGYDAADANIHSLENLRDVDVDIDHRHIETVVVVMLQ